MSWIFPCGFLGAILFLAAEPLLLRRPGWFGFSPAFRFDGCLQDQFHELLQDDFPVPFLIARFLSGQDQDPVAIDSPSGDFDEPRFQSRFEAAVGVEIKPQFNRCFHFVDILPAGASGTAELILQIFLINLD